MSYIGPAPKGTSVYLSGTGTGDGATTVFPMGFTARADAEVIVTLDGVVQHTSAYTISGSNCTFSAAPAGSVAIEFRILQALGFVAEVGDGAVNQSKIDTSSLTPLAQRVREVNAAYSSSGSNIIPYDDSIPQNTEGTEIVTATITPKKIGNKLYIRAYFMGVHSAAGVLGGALFKDSDADAIATAASRISDAGAWVDLTTETYVTVASLSAVTYKFRVGGSTSGTLYINGNTVERKYGGVGGCWIEITEIAQ